MQRTHTYSVRIKVKGQVIPMQIEARTVREARLLLEATYGAGSVLSNPVQLPDR